MNERYVRTYSEHYSAIRKDEILPFATTWMELENLVVIKISQRGKIKNHMISLIYGILKLKVTNEQARKANKNS